MSRHVENATKRPAIQVNRDSSKIAGPEGFEPSTSGWLSGTVLSAGLRDILSVLILTRLRAHLPADW
jgi:hypothetical protein